MDKVNICTIYIAGFGRDQVDKVYNEEKQPLPVRQKHILEKASRSLFFTDKQTTTGTHRQSLVIKPNYFIQGFEYVVKVQAGLKGR